MAATSRMFPTPLSHRQTPLSRVLFLRIDAKSLLSVRLLRLPSVPRRKNHLKCLLCNTDERIVPQPSVPRGHELRKVTDMFVRHPSAAHQSKQKAKIGRGSQWHKSDSALSLCSCCANSHSCGWPFCRLFEALSCLPFRPLPYCAVKSTYMWDFAKKVQLLFPRRIGQM